MSKFRLFYTEHIYDLVNSTDAKQLKDYLCKKQIKKVGLYAYGKFCGIVQNILMNNGIDVEWIMDRNSENLKGESEIPIVNPTDTNLPSIDLLIITNIELSARRSLYKELLKLVDCEVVSLSDLLLDVKYEDKKELIKENSKTERLLRKEGFAGIDYINDTSIIPKKKYLYVLNCKHDLYAEMEKDICSKYPNTVIHLYDFLDCIEEFRG